MAREPSNTALLQLLRGQAPSRTFVLDQEVTTFGKQPDCDIILRLPTVSKLHAQIVHRPDGYYVEDLKSRNHTYLDGEKLKENCPAPLRDGQRIRICEFVFVFSVPSDGPKPGEGSSTILNMLNATMPTDRQLVAVRPEEKLRAILQIGRDLVGVLDLTDILEKILSNLFKIFPQADRGFVLLQEDGVADLVPKAIKTRDGGSGRLAISKTIFDHVMQEGQAILSEDAMAAFQGSPSIADANLRTLMVVPLCDRQRRPVGIVQIDTSDQRSKFVLDDLNLLVAVAGQMSVAVENARLHTVLLREEKMKQEYRHAAEVQRTFLPQRRPAQTDYEFWDDYKPAQSVGGDLYDYVPITGPDDPESRWAIALGDVAGKGMAAALLMARFSAEFRLLLQFEPDPARVVERLNRDLCQSGNAERFITFLLCLIDTTSHELTVVNAGHMGPMIRRLDGRVEVIGQASNGLPLAIDENQVYRGITVTLGPGDVVVLYTDGVTEANDRRGHFLGTEGLIEVVAGAPTGASAVGTTILNEIRRHTAGCDQYDDITLLCFGRS